MQFKWPGKYTSWIENRTIYVSIPFTWELEKVSVMLSQMSFEWDHAVVGGPAVELVPEFFDMKGMDWVKVKHECPGVLQRINPLATRTTEGCVNHCAFCGVHAIEPGFKELNDWPDLPVICDNNLLAATKKHFDRVIDRLIVHGWANFNQGLDVRRLTDYHAMRISQIKDPMVYLALDNIADRDSWECAYNRLRSAGILKRQIRSYALIGFNSGLPEAWERCNWIEGHGVKAMPQWFHELDTLKHNVVTKRQSEFGWNDYERRRIMQWFYQHKNAIRGLA